MSNMPAGPAPAYTTHENTPFPPTTALPPRIHAAPIIRDAPTHPATTHDQIETRRRRHEREDALAQRAGTLWRGRGPVSKKGCFGRIKPGREGRLRRRWYAAICLFFTVVVVAAILLAVFLTRNGDNTPVESQWLNLTGYPPMPTGISTVAGPDLQLQQSGCIPLTSLWSCALPKEQHGRNEPYDPSQPNFRVEIRFRNGSYEHSTALERRSLEQEQGQSLRKRGPNQLFNPNPEPPSLDEQRFLGQYTDNTSKPYAGEETPFYITLLSPEHLSGTLTKRDSNTSSNPSTSNSSNSNSDSNPFPDLKEMIPPPSLSPDGTAAKATLYPLPSSQPIRLYNRGEKNEHYGFYTYFDKSIFLSSDSALAGSTENNPGDLAGGSTEEEARVRCTWGETRFLVQIWTGEGDGKMIFPTATSTSTSSSSPTSSPSPSSSSSPSSVVNSATDFTRPGSFPYPVSITLDRHGGDPRRKPVYCYGMESGQGQHVNASEVKLQIEQRGFDGHLVNQAPGLFDMGEENSNSNATSNVGEGAGEEKEYGGYDGGVGGCACRWVNWVGSV